MDNLLKSMVYADCIKIEFVEAHKGRPECAQFQYRKVSMCMPTVKLMLHQNHLKDYLITQLPNFRRPSVTSLNLPEGRRFGNDA